MPDQIHVSPDGVKYRLVATKTTTPKTDAEPKIVTVDPDTVEVLVSDSRLVSEGSQFGHVAISVNGVVYSRAHGGYDSKKTRDEYIAIQQTFRDTVSFIVRVSPQEKQTIEQELKRRVTLTYVDPKNHKYSLLDNSCSSNIADVFNMVGIVAYDPRWSGFGMVSPEDIATGLSHSKRLVKKIMYAKGS
jgi:hypothetical protein